MPPTPTNMAADGNMTDSTSHDRRTRRNVGSIKDAHADRQGQHNHSVTMVCHVALGA